MRWIGFFNQLRRLVPYTWLVDPSPLVRAMAVWALSRLASREAVGELYAKSGAAEPDDGVRGEWQTALSLVNG